VRQQHENLLPEKKRVPNEPPTLNKKVFQTRRFRHVITAGGTTTSYTVLTEQIYTDFGIPATATPFQIESISAWAFADTTVSTVNLSLLDEQTGKSFSDTSQIGQPASKVAYRFPLVTRQAFFKETSGTNFTTLTFTAGAQVVIDVVLSILV